MHKILHLCSATTNAAVTCKEFQHICILLISSMAAYMKLIQVQALIHAYFVKNHSANCYVITATVFIMVGWRCAHGVYATLRTAVAMYTWMFGLIQLLLNVSAGSAVIRNKRVVWWVLGLFVATKNCSVVYRNLILSKSVTKSS